MLYQRGGAATADNWALDMVDGKTFPFIESPGPDTQARFSPNGRWVAYVSSDSTGPQVYVQPFPGPGEKRQVSGAGGVEPRWSGSGAELFYVERSFKMMAAAIDTSFQVRSLTHLFDVPLAGTPRANYDVTTDGQRFLVNTRRESESGPMIAVLNWTSALRK